MTKPTNFFEELAGVPVHYDRLAPPYGYGSKGKPYRFHCTPAFESKLHTCFSELFEVCPLGKAEVITSAGAYVGKPGLHGQGRAFDLDGLFWAEKSFVTLIDGGKGDRRFYHAVEAILRRHFGTVLNYDYNVSHRDHLHIDDGSRVGFDAGSRARVLFLQGALKSIFGRALSVDGSYGLVTKQLAQGVLEELNISGHLSTLAVWKRFLLETARKGFQVYAEPTDSDADPLQALHYVYRVLQQHDDCECRKDIESAINAFANHDKTQQWLKQFR